ncbi:MAG: hypothetical protein FVQ84_07965 [Planctomycetes bacterium]|nr:hypothetical protein [Planctomycetota bacterium]
MRLRRKVWIVIIAVCIGVSVYEIPKAVYIWRYICKLAHVEDIFNNDTDDKSTLKEEIKALDPEAFDILRYCITEPNDEELAILLVRYPQNEFFLAQFAEKKLIDANLVDSQAVLALTDRLIKLDPNNSHYRYLKGWAILNRPGESEREMNALEQFELGNKLPDFALPYDKYKEHVDGLSDKVGLNPLKRQISLPYETGFYPDLGFFISGSRGRYPKLDEESFSNISAELSKAASKLIDYARSRKNLNSSYMLLRSIEGARLQELDLSEEEAQLVRFRLSQAIEANKVLWQYDFEMFAVREGIMNLALVGKVFTLFIRLLPFPLVWIFVVIVNRIRGRAQQVSVGITTYIFFIIGLCSMLGLLFLIAVLNEWLGGRSLGGSVFIGTAVIVWILLLLLARVRPLAHSRIRQVRRWSTVICGLIWVIGTFVLVLVNLVWTKGLTDVTEWLVFLGGVLLAWFVLCLIIWAIVTYWKNMLGVIPFGWLLRNRFVQLMLVLLLMTGTTALLRPIPIASLVFFFLTILFVALISTHISKDRSICFDGIRHFFGRSGEIINTRMKMERITFPISVLYLVTVIVTIHISADKCPDLDKLFNNPPSVNWLLPGATQETYETVLSKKHTADPNAPVYTTIKEDDGIPEELYLACPEDLSALISERQAANKPIREKLLLEVLRRGGHDVRPVILDALKEPNSLDMLIMRAKWKDRSAKQQLEQIYEEKTAQLTEIVSSKQKNFNSIKSSLIQVNRGDKKAYTKINTRRLTTDANMPELPKIPRTKIGHEHLTKLLEIAGALAFVSDPQEAEARFTNLINLVGGEQRDDIPPDVQESSRSLLKLWLGTARYSRATFFYRYLEGVPKPNVTNLLKDFVKQRQMAHLYDNYNELLHVLSRACDRELAEWVFQIVAESPPIRSSHVYLEDVPTGRPVHISEFQKLKREWQTKNDSYKFLETIYPYLNDDSIPLLLEHLDSDNEQLRSFVVWRLTSLGYEWTDEQLRALLKDDYWKVRLNTLFACDTDDLETAFDDENSTVRVVAQILMSIKDN